MALPPPAAHHRAQFAALCRDRAPDDPVLIKARRSLRAQRLADHVDRVLSEWPPLSDAQRDRIASLLRAGARGGAA
jgi:hypothetical protein